MWHPRDAFLPIFVFFLTLLIAFGGLASGFPSVRPAAAATGGDCILTVEPFNPVVSAFNWLGGMRGKGRLDTTGTSYDGMVNTTDRKMTEVLEVMLDLHIETDPDLGVPKNEIEKGHGTVPGKLAQEVKNSPGSPISPEAVKYAIERVVLKGNDGADLDAAVVNAVQNLRNLLASQGKDTGPAIVTNRDRLLKSLKKKLDVRLTITAEGALDGKTCRAEQKLTGSLELDEFGGAINVPLEEPKKEGKPGK